jgi:hypothetical protein
MRNASAPSESVSGATTLAPCGAAAGGALNYNHRALNYNQVLAPWRLVVPRQEELSAIPYAVICNHICDHICNHICNHSNPVRRDLTPGTAPPGS